MGCEGVGEGQRSHRRNPFQRAFDSCAVHVRRSESTARWLGLRCCRAQSTLCFVVMAVWDCGCMLCSDSLSSLLLTATGA